MFTSILKIWHPRKIPLIAHLLKPTTEFEWTGARPSEGINTWSHFWFWSDPEPFIDRGERAEITLLTCWDLSSLLFINLTAAAIHGAGGEMLFTSLTRHHREKRGERRESSRVSCECWIHRALWTCRHTHTHTHTRCRANVSSRLMYSKISGADKHWMSNAN